MSQSQPRYGIATYLTLEQFNEFVLPHLQQSKSRPSAEALLAHDLQIHSEALVPRLSVEY